MQNFALALVFLFAASTAPQRIGDVEGVGSVQLRGVGISEGTVFSGDRLSVAPGGYARVNIDTGPKIEVGGSSEVILSVSQEANVIVRMHSGNIAFTSEQKSVRVRVGVVYEIASTGQTKGSVAFVGSEAFGIRVMDGTVRVNNTVNKQSFTLQKGEEKLLSLSESSQFALPAPSALTAIPAAPTMPTKDNRLRKIVKFIFRK